MKNLILAIRACKKADSGLFLTSKENEQPICRTARLRILLASRLLELESYARGHMNQLDKLADFNSRTYITTQNFSEVDAVRARTMRSRLEWILAVCELEKSGLPENPLFQAIWQADCGSPLFRQAGFSALRATLRSCYSGTSNIFDPEDFRVFEEDGVLKVQAQFFSKNRVARAHRVWTLQPAAFRSLEDFWTFRRDMLRVIPKPSEIDQLPEFSKAAVDNALRSRAQQAFKQTLSQFPAMQQAWILDNWSSVHPLGWTVGIETLGPILPNRHLLPSRKTT